MSTYREKRKQRELENFKAENNQQEENSRFYKKNKKTNEEEISSKKTKEEKKNKSSNLDKEKLGFGIMLQNFTLYSIYRKLILLGILSTFTFIVFLSGLLFLTNEQVEPRYIPVETSGKVYKEHPLNTPFVQDGEIVKNAIDVSKMLYTFDYKNWKSDQQILRASSYFDEDAWGEFQNSLIASKNMEAVEDGKRVVSVEITANPSIKSRVNPNLNVFEWEVTVPMLIVYESPFKEKGLLKQIGNGEFRYRRTKLENNPRQYHIVRFRFEPK